MDELNCAHPRRWCPGFDGLYQGNVCADYPEEARRTAKKKKKGTQNPKWWTRYYDAQDFMPSLRASLSRPFIMLLTEPICIFWDVYDALVYGVLYHAYILSSALWTNSVLSNHRSKEETNDHVAFKETLAMERHNRRGGSMRKRVWLRVR